MIVSQTERLTLRWLDYADAQFIHTLVNDPTWLRNIGDRGVRTLEDARAYLRDGPMQMYANVGFGLYAMVRQSDQQRIGICGLLKRDTLPDVDIGYALLPQYSGNGYALEAARACVELARCSFGLTRLIAITAPDNTASARLLVNLGMRLEEQFLYAASKEMLCRYGMALAD